MKRIFKYTIPVGVPIKLPSNADVVHVEEQGSMVQIWATLDDTAPETFKTFQIVGTGHEFPDSWSHIGTAKVGPFVWHVMEIPA